MQFKIADADKTLELQGWRDLTKKGWYRYKHMGSYHYLYLACDLDTKAWVVYYGKRV